MLRHESTSTVVQYLWQTDGACLSLPRSFNLALKFKLSLYLMRVSLIVIYILSIPNSIVLEIGDCSWRHLTGLNNSGIKMQLPTAKMEFSEFSYTINFIRNQLIPQFLQRIQIKSLQIFNNNRECYRYQMNILTIFRFIPFSR